MTSLLALAACSSAPGAPVAMSPGVTPVPASPQAMQPQPAVAALTASEAGLPLVASRDGITPEESASTQRDEPHALALYHSWGWLTESTRRFGRGAHTIDLTVLLTQSADSAEAAFQYLATAAAEPPLAASACPHVVPALAACAHAGGLGVQIITGRVGAEVFQITAHGLDPGRLATTQAIKLAG